MTYLGTKFIDAELVGIEPVPELIEVGKILNPRINFIQKGLFDIKLNDLGDRGDLVIAAFVKKLAQLVNESGKIFVFSPFNEEPIDVILKYKYSENQNWEIGHNLFSMRSMEQICEKLNLSPEWVDFKMSIPIPKSSDPMRSWTEPFRGNPNCLIYGTNMFSTMKLLILKKG